MNMAQKIISKFKDAHVAQDCAQKQASYIDQYWENEATLYEFEDGSVLTDSTLNIDRFSAHIDMITALAAL